MCGTGVGVVNECFSTKARNRANSSLGLIAVTEVNRFFATPICCRSAAKAQEWGDTAGGAGGGEAEGGEAGVSDAVEVAEGASVLVEAVLVLLLAETLGCLCRLER